MEGTLSRADARAQESDLAIVDGRNYAVCCEVWQNFPAAVLPWFFPCPPPNPPPQAGRASLPPSPLVGEGRGGGSGDGRRRARKDGHSLAAAPYQSLVGRTADQRRARAALLRAARRARRLPPTGEHFTTGAADTG